VAGGVYVALLEFDRDLRNQRQAAGCDCGGKLDWAPGSLFGARIFLEDWHWSCGKSWTCSARSLLMGRQCTLDPRLLGEARQFPCSSRHLVDGLRPPHHGLPKLGALIEEPDGQSALPAEVDVELWRQTRGVRRQFHDDAGLVVRAPDSRNTRSIPAIPIPCPLVGTGLRLVACCVDSTGVTDQLGFPTQWRTGQMAKEQLLGNSLDSRGPIPAADRTLDWQASAVRHRNRGDCLDRWPHKGPRNGEGERSTRRAGSTTNRWESGNASVTPRAKAMRTSVPTTPVMSRNEIKPLPTV
jgi:hypothetical protein